MMSKIYFEKSLLPEARLLLKIIEQKEMESIIFAPGSTLILFRPVSHVLLVQYAET